MNCLSTSFDNQMSSCWESNDNGRSGGEGLVMIDGRKEQEDGMEVRWVAKQESSRRDAKDFSLIGVPLFSSWGLDSKVLIGVAVGVWAMVVPRFWEHRGDGWELEGRREDGLILSNS